MPGLTKTNRNVLLSIKSNNMDFMDIDKSIDKLKQESIFCKYVSIICLIIVIIIFIVLRKDKRLTVANKQHRSCGYQRVAGGCGS
jgi:hypothetical protein